MPKNISNLLKNYCRREEDMLVSCHRRAMQEIHESVQFIMVKKDRRKGAG